MPVETREIEANGLTFHCREAAGSGEAVILLHGFPETSHMWLPLMDRLSAEGYRCLAPDQRGYSPGARPDGVESYHLPQLVSDIAAIADAWGASRFHLVGHDWGAGVGWGFVAMHPERVLSWTALSVPHPAAFGAAIRDDPDQQQRSQYIGVFQQPGVAEAMLSANDFGPLKAIWNESPPEQVEEYVAVLSQPGALTAALNWYRGVADADPDRTFAPVSTPTLMIWGNQDPAIGRSAVMAGAADVAGPYRLVEIDAGHWLMQQATARVIDEIVAHVTANPAT